MTPSQASSLTNTGSSGTHFFRVWMPHSFLHIPEAKWKWTFLPLNRNYKPLGLIDGTHDRVDYTDYVESHGVVFSANPANISDVWDSVNNEGEHLFLYSDVTATRMTYFERLSKVMARSVFTAASKGR